jgi:hypothetical protein
MGGDLAGCRGAPRPHRVARLRHDLARPGLRGRTSTATTRPTSSTSTRTSAPTRSSKQLVEAVHARDMRIVYDFVPNHTSASTPGSRTRSATARTARTPTSTSSTRTAPTTSRSSASTSCPSSTCMTPDRPAARYLLDEVVPFYLEDLGFDGFRIDHAKGPGSEDSEGTVDNQLFLAALRELVDGMEGEKYLFGEIWSPRVADRRATPDVLDGALNFPLHDALSPRWPATPRSPRSTTPCARTSTPTPTASCDELPRQPRRPALRLPGRQRRRARERLKLAFTAQFTLPGSPVVYNGTDIGMGQTANTEAAGGGWVDRWYREPFPWPDADWAHSGSDGFVLQEWHQDVADQVADLNALRDAEPALIHGTYETVHAAGDLLLFERSHGDDRLLTVINRGGDRTLDLDELYGAAIPDGVTLTALLGDGTVTSSDGSLDVEVAGVSGEVFAVTGDLPPAPGPDTGPGRTCPRWSCCPAASSRSSAAPATGSRSARRPRWSTTRAATVGEHLHDPGRQLGVQGRAERLVGRQLRRGRRARRSEPHAVAVRADRRSRSSSTTAPAGSATTTTAPSPTSPAASSPRSAAPVTGTRRATARGCRTSTATASTPTSRRAAERATTSSRSRSAAAGTPTTRSSPALGPGLRRRWWRAT